MNPKIKLNYKKLIAYLTSLVFIGGIILYFLTKDKEEIYFEQNTLYLANHTIQEVPENDIAIHITGEVNSPGLVFLKPHSRIADAIEASSGITDLADLDKINLAYELQDGQKVYIPSIYDDSLSPTITTSMGNNSPENETNSPAKININSATQSDLESLPGIGKSTANKILEYRKKNGKFKSLEDIMNVSRYWRKQIQPNKRLYFPLIFLSLCDFFTLCSTKFLMTIYLLIIEPIPFP